VSQPLGSNSLSELPAKLMALIATVPDAARAVTAASVDLWSPDSWPPLIATLQQVRFSWRIQFVRDQTETFLFFIKIPEGKWVMLDATASIGILGAWGLEPADPLALEDVRRLAQLPAFLIATPSDDFANTYKPPRGDVSQTIFLALGADGRNILAVSNPDQGKKALLRYSPNGIPGIAPKSGYPLAAFWDLTWTLRDWYAAGGRMASPIVVPDPGPRQTDVQLVLTRFAEAYAQCSNTFRIDSSTPWPPPLQQRFRVADFFVRMAIPVAEDGTIAEDPEDEQSRIVVGMNAVSGNPAVATATLGLPDFVVSGALYDEFFLALSRARDELASWLHQSPAVVDLYLASARSRSAIFRVGKGDGYLKFLMILSVTAWNPEILVIRADFEGDFGDNPAIDVQELLDVQEYPADSSPETVNYGEMGQYFLPLIAAIRFWTNTLLTW
jgi:hypothetical protein